MDDRLKKYNFDKGLRVLSYDVKDSPFTAIDVSVGVGSRYENYDEIEMAHFLEHCMFSGTKIRPNNKVIGFEVESIGGSMNATTRSEITSYYIKVPGENTKKAIEILLDMILHSTFEKQYIDLEKNVVIEELKMYKDNPQYRAWVLLDELIFKNTIMGVSLDKQIESTKDIDRSKVLSFINKHYFSNNMIISIAGNISSLDIKSTINEFFDFSSINKGTNTFSKMKFNDKDRVLLYDMKTEQSTFILGMKGFSYTDDRIYTLNVLSVILGGGFGSKLFQILRNEKGLVYDINASNTPFIDGGLFTISSGTDNRNFIKALTSIIKVLKDFGKGEFDDKDIKRAKEFIKAGLSEIYETVDRIAYSLSMGELLIGEILTLEEKKRRIDAVTKDDILSVFDNIFRDIYLASVTSFDNSQLVLDILSDV